VVVGSDRAAISVDRPTRTPAVDDVGTIVARYPRASAGGENVTVLAVDPETFERWAFWINSFADVSLRQLLDKLGPGAEGSVNAIAVGLPEGAASVRLGERDVSLRVVETVQTFPGRRLPFATTRRRRGILG